MGRSEREKEPIQGPLHYSHPTGTLIICPSSLNTVMFTFEERYRPLKAGAKFVCLYFSRSRDETYKRENLHIKCIGVDVQFMAKINDVQSCAKSSVVITTDLPMAIISYGNFLINWLAWKNIYIRYSRSSEGLGSTSWASIPPGGKPSVRPVPVQNMLWGWNFATCWRFDIHTYHRADLQNRQAKDQRRAPG